MPRFLRRHVRLIGASLFVAALVATVTYHIATQPKPELQVNATATLTIADSTSPEGSQLSALFGGTISQKRLALVELSWHSNGKACALDAVMHPDGGWTFVGVQGSGDHDGVTPHEWPRIVADNPQALLLQGMDTPIALTRSRGTLSILYGLDDTAIDRAPSARVWLVDRCGKTKPLQVQLTHT